MNESAARREQRRIEELIFALEALPDPQARACATALVRSVLALHGEGLARLLAILADAGEPGRTMVELLAGDESVRALLLLHDLHPLDLAARVDEAIAGLQAELGARGIGIELLHASDASVRLKVSGIRDGKALATAAFTHEIEAAIFDAAPEVAAIEIEGLPEANVHPLKFIPAAALRRDPVRADSR